MPTSTTFITDGGGGGTSSSLYDVLGLPTPAPPSPAAPPTLGGSPTVSSTPRPGGGIATDAVGHLPVSVIAQAIGVYSADPISPVVGQIWYRSDTDKLSVMTTGGVKRSAAFT